MRVIAFVSLAMLFAAAFAAVEETEQLQAVAVASYQPGLVRTFVAAAEPGFGAPYGIAMKGSAIKWGQGSAEVDVLGFAMRNPSDILQPSKAMAFYLGYFTSSASWSAGVGLSSVSASLAELVASYTSVAAYYDRDGQTGFSWRLGQPLYCLNGLPLNGQSDCVEAAAIYDLTAKTWNPITIANQSCPSGYTANCRVYAFTTSTTDGVFTITMKLASEPVLVNNVKVDPSYAKVDITINFPWSSFTTAAGAKLVLFGAYAGKAGNLGIQSVTVDGAKGLLFTAASTSAYFSWDSISKIGGASKNVYALGISGTTIKNYDCGQCDIFSAAAIALYKTWIAVWEGFGWSVQFVAFSWADVQTGAVVWDPVMGVTTPQTVIGAAGVAAPAALLTAAAAALALAF